MWKRPGASELLTEIAELLEGELLAHLADAGPLQHRVRVAGNLCRILEREARLGPPLATREKRLLGELLGAVSDSPERDLAERLTAGRDADPAVDWDVDFERRVWRCLVAIVRQRLRISKPGHDAYDFASEAERTGVER